VMLGDGLSIMACPSVPGRTTWRVETEITLEQKLYTLIPSRFSDRSALRPPSR
jgi:hypothetical protein